MEYRHLPHGDAREAFSVLGLGTGSLQTCPPAEAEAVIRTAMEHGINYFDLCAGGSSVYAAFGKAIAGQRERVFFPLHFGAVYNQDGEYAWSRDPGEIEKTFAWELKTLGTDYADFGFLHCVDEAEDYEKLISSGVLDLLQRKKAGGEVRHLGFSTHTPAVANRILDTGLMDLMLFSLNPAYDFEKGDAYGIGSVSERASLLRRCEKDGVGVAVMKPFHAGKLLDAKTSPFGVALTHEQCLQYALDRPGVLTTVPGVRGMADVNRLLRFLDAPAEARDYACLGELTAASAEGHCVYCNHCQPCPAGIDIGLVNKYYDLARAGDVLAAKHYEKLAVQAGACIGCGHCDRRCPFHAEMRAHMEEIRSYFGA